MKIIFTVNTYYPYKDGVSVVTQYLAEGLAQKGHEVLVMTSSCDGAPLDEEYHGVKIYRDDIITVHAIHRGDKRKYQHKIIELSKKTDIIINVCTQTARTDWVLPVLDKIECTKILYINGIIDFKWQKSDVSSVSAFASKLWNNIRWGWLYTTQRNNLKKYDAVTQLHEFDHGNIFFKTHYGIQSVIFENAAEDAFFRKDDAEKKHSKTMVSVANYCERKNQMLCLEAFYKADISNEWKLRFIGSEKNAYYECLLKRKEELDLQYHTNKNVVFDTEIPRSEIAGIVSEADIYLLGSRWEAFPISIVETMAAGVPFISTDVGCVKYFPGGEIVKDAEDMAYWIRELAANEKLCQVLGNAGAVFALEHFQIKDKVEQLEQLLGRLIEEKRK